MISIGKNILTLNDLYKILFEGEKIELDADARQHVEANYNFLESFAKGKVIYGINTGLGPMAQYKISDENAKSLQYNLIRSHCSGLGKPLSDTNVKSAMIARLNTLMQAHS